MDPPVQVPSSRPAGLIKPVLKLQSPNLETIRRIGRRRLESGGMDPHLNSRAAIAPRSDMSGGAIAGAVIGAIVGVAIISIVLGFLYFRWKRRSHDESTDGDKPSITERRLSLSGLDRSAEQPQTAHDSDHQQDSQPWPGDGQFDPDGMPSWAYSMDYSQQPFPGHDRESPVNAGGFQARHHDHSTRNGDSTSHPQDLEDTVLDTYVPPTTGPEGGAADYYDTNIIMESEPEAEPTPGGPTRQMTELYEEQLKQARQSRKNSKGSTWSRLKQGLLPKRKRSTRVSEIAMEEGHRQSSSSPTHPDVPITSIEGSSNKALEGDHSFGPVTELFEEPQEISDSSRVDLHAHKRAKRRGPSGDTSGIVAHRLDSLQTEFTSDPQLPSSALRRKPTLADQSATRQPTRFQSPDLPGPMELDDSLFVDGDRTSAVRGSHSPPNDTAGFSAVNPMEIMRPSNAAEKAVFTNAELTRLTSTSVSPPTSPPYSASTPPEAHVQHNPAVREAEEEEDDDADESDYDVEGDFDEYIQTFEQPPQIAIDETFTTDGPSDWSTPAGTTLTNASSGRTPATEMLSSPSPAPSNMLQPDSSASPPEISSSPKPHLTCEECGRMFDQIHKLNHHKRYHDRKHVCLYQDCGKKFGTKTHLDRHINDKHEKKKGFHCTQEGCQYFKGGKSFPRKDNWRRHMINKHGITPTVDPQPAE
ncbi:hypothetical protein TruAng_009275 [Truncatella angustata]|nr:hypothetical protein TruAng_009275 [Truncatella angustata]